MGHLIKNRKAQEAESGGFSTAIWFVLLVIGLAILILLIWKELAFGQELSESAACYTSIVGSMLSSEETRAKCPIKDYLAQNKVIKEFKDGKQIDSAIVKDFSLDDKKVSELFAALMKDCLKKGGGVNSRAFSRTWFSSSTVCLECSNVEFDKSIAKATFSGLRKYLENNKIPGSDKKYVEVFTRDDLHKEDWIYYGIENDLLSAKYDAALEKDQIYTVFFIGIKEGTASAVALGRRLIGREDVYYVYTATQENFNKVCERKVN